MNKLFKLLGILVLVSLFVLPVAGCYESVQTLIPTIESPQDGSTVTTSLVTITGSVNKTAKVKINDVEVPVKDMKFSTSVSLTEGRNVISVVATWHDKETVSKTVTVNYMPPK